MMQRNIFPKTTQKTRPVFYAPKAGIFRTKTGLKTDNNGHKQPNTATSHANVIYD
jgi:hypothetical protein